MKPEISIIIPAIRVQNWPTIYQSITQSTHRPFELILVGPYALPSELQGFRNVKYVKDFGNPVRCFNIGLLMCEGTLLTYIADDGTFLPGALERAIQTFITMPAHPKNVLILKYTEGQPVVQSDDYYRLTNAYPRVAAARDDWWIFNLTLLQTDYMVYLGGVDAQFETGAFGHADLSVRAQQDGCNTLLFAEPVVHNTHGHADHVPVERGHVDHDDPLYRHIHNNPTNQQRITIDINNWKLAPSIWTRRFAS